MTLCVYDYARSMIAKLVFSAVYVRPNPKLKHLWS